MLPHKTASSSVRGIVLLMLALGSATLLPLPAWAQDEPEGKAGEPAKNPHLADEQLVFPAEDSGWRIRRSYWPQMRLSPDGSKLLYVRTSDEKCSLLLRDLATGKDVRVPIEPIAKEIADLYPRINLFDPAGTRLVLPVFGKIGPLRTSKILLWTIGDAAPTETKLQGSMLIGEFDHTGKALIVLNGRPLSLAKEPDYKSDPLGIEGMLWSCSPTDELICVARMTRQADRKRPKVDLALFDTNSRQVVDSIDVEDGSQLDDLETKWTTDGRYIYFADGGTKLWDREDKTRLAKIATGYPIGPGPTPSSMVIKLMPQPAADGADAEPNILLHDALTGQGWPLGDPQCDVQDARAGKIIYLRNAEDGSTSVHTARIAM